MLRFTAALALAFTCSFAHATGFDSAYQNCFRQDWGQRSVSIQPAGKYQVAWYDPTVTFLGKGLFTVVGGAQELVPFSQNNLNADGQMQILAAYINRAAQHLPKDRWAEYRKGCMVLCATASYLRYEELMSTKFGGMGSLVSQRAGVCTEFARFADRLAGRVGIPSRFVGNVGERHAYVKFWMYGPRQWYYAEPQDTSCTYYDPKR